MKKLFQCESYGIWMCTLFKIKICEIFYDCAFYFSLVGWKIYYAWMCILFVIKIYEHFSSNFMIMHIFKYPSLDGKCIFKIFSYLHSCWSAKFVNFLQTWMVVQLFWIRKLILKIFWFVHIGWYLCWSGKFVNFLQIWMVVHIFIG